MSKQEKRIVEVEKRVDTLEAVFKSFMQEMRDRDNQRAAEIMELRQDMKTMQANLDAKIDGMGKHVRNLSVATIIGVATIAVTVMYSILSH
ncbi:MAG: hypothetical protein SR1Q7_01755 [Quinella sp. 1Q7]|nr:hypothetical protein [Quinella sp. 1Q7]